MPYLRFAHLSFTFRITPSRTALNIMGLIKSPCFVLSHCAHALTQLLRSKVVFSLFEVGQGVAGNVIVNEGGFHVDHFIPAGYLIKNKVAQMQRIGHTHMQ